MVVVPSGSGVGYVEQVCRRDALDMRIAENNIAVLAVPQGIPKPRRKRRYARRKPITTCPKQAAAYAKIRTKS